jgi:hypothetical protein
MTESRDSWFARRRENARRKRQEERDREHFVAQRAQTHAGATDRFNARAHGRSDAMAWGSFWGGSGGDCGGGGCGGGCGG